MKRTCLHKITNTHENESCELHLAIRKTNYFRMKKTIFSLFVVAVTFVGLTSASIEDENKLIGNWEIIASKINGQEDVRSMNINRTQEFRADQTFEGRFSLQPGSSQIYNYGKYFLANDTTMVTIHSDQNGKLSPLAYVYTVKIKSDTLHLYGFYTSPAMDKTGILNITYIDEYWTRKH